MVFVFPGRFSHVPPEKNPGVFLPVRGAEDRQFEGLGFPEVDFHRNFQGVTRYFVQYDFLIGRHGDMFQPDMVAAQRFHGVPGTDVQGALFPGQQARKGHRLRKIVLAGESRIRVEQDDDAPFSVRIGRRCVYASSFGRPVIEISAVRDDEFLAPGVVVADQVFASAFVAEIKKDVFAFAADGIKIGAGSVVAHESVRIGIDERMEVLPAEKVGRPVEVFGKHALAAGPGVRIAA